MYQAQEGQMPQVANHPLVPEARDVELFAMHTSSRYGRTFYITPLSQSQVLEMHVLHRSRTLLAMVMVKSDSQMLSRAIQYVHRWRCGHFLTSVPFHTFSLRRSVLYGWANAPPGIL